MRNAIARSRRQVPARGPHDGAAGRRLRFPDAIPITIALTLALTTALALGGCGGSGSGDGTFTFVPRADHLEFSISPPATLAAGDAFDVEVRVIDTRGRVLREDGLAIALAPVLPLGAVLGPAQATTVRGRAVFAGLRVEEAGTGFRLRAETAGIPPLDSAAFTVLPAAPASLEVVHGPVSIAPTATASVVVTAQDAYGNPAPAYRGTVHMTTTDGAAVLPSDHTYASGDGGTWTFPVVFETPGAQVVTATDVGNASITGEVTIQVLPWPVINEIYYDEPSFDGATVFVELHGAPGTVLDRLTLVGINGNISTDGIHGDVYDTIVLTGTIPADGFFVISDVTADAGLAAVSDLQDTGADLQNGADGIALYRDYGTASESKLDGLAYGTAAVELDGEGTPAPDVAPGTSLGRTPDGFDSQDNAADFASFTPPTPGAPNS